MTQELIERLEPCGDRLVVKVRDALIEAAITGGGSYRRDIEYLTGNPVRLARAAIEACDQSQSARIAELDAQDERVREAMFVLSDRLRASGILSASDAVHKAYEAVVLSLSHQGLNQWVS